MAVSESAADAAALDKFCAQGIHTLDIFMVVVGLFVVSLLFMNKEQRSFAFEIVFGLISFAIFMVVELCKALDDNRK